MNSSAAEFRRALIQAFGDAVRDDDAGLLLEAEGVVLHFALCHEEVQRLGALSIASLRVTVSVRQGAADAASSLLARVDRATQRGGG